MNTLQIHVKKIISEYTTYICVLKLQLRKADRARNVSKSVRETDTQETDREGDASPVRGDTLFSVRQYDH